MERAQTRVYSFLNIAAWGMTNDALEQEPSAFDIAKTAEIALRHRDVVVGIKSAHYWKPDWLSVDSAVAAGERAGIPAMVDFGYFRRERPYRELVGRHLRPGDFSTHCFRGPVPVLDEAGKVYDYLFEARGRGVVFDLGHGMGSFLFRNAVGALKGGSPPGRSAIPNWAPSAPAPARTSRSGISWKATSASPTPATGSCAAVAVCSAR